MNIEKAPSEVVAVDGKYATVINKAIIHVGGKNFDLHQYKIVLMETKDTWVVVFRAKDLPRGYRGSPQGVPGYEVIFRKDDLVVEREYFSR